MLVHSFSPTKKWFENFVEFSVAMGMIIKTSGAVSPLKICEQVSLRLAWVSDKARP